jgi:hypothetical protein
MKTETAHETFAAQPRWPARPDLDETHRARELPRHDFLVACWMLPPDEPERRPRVLHARHRKFRTGDFP